MSQTAKAGALATAAADDESLLSPVEILDRLWRIATSVRTALALILALAVLGFLGALIIQAPPGLRGDREAYASWVDSVRPKYGGWTGVMDALQLFTLFSSVWFKAILVGLATSIAACSVNRWKGLWRTAVHPRIRMTGAFYARAPHSAEVATAVGDEAALELVRGVFRGQHFRTVVERDGEAIHVYADRFRWTPFGTLLAHISLILIVVGALIGASWGFRDDQFAVAVGSREPVGNGTGLTVEARSFQDSYYENGAPSDYASDLVVYRDGAPVASQTIRVNQPLRYGDVSFYQSFYGAAATLKIADQKGTVLFDGGVPLLWESTEGNRRIGRVALPDAGLTVFVVGVASGETDPQIRPGQMQIEVYRAGDGNTPIATQIVSQGAPARIAGLDLTFVRERQFTGLIVARDPGMPFVWGGAILLVSGLFLVFFLPNRRIWARIQPAGGGSVVQVGATARHDATLAPAFDRLATDLRLALAGPSAS